MLMLNNADVAKVLDMPMCMAALDGVFAALGRIFHPLQGNQCVDSADRAKRSNRRGKSLGSIPGP